MACRALFSLEVESASSSEKLTLIKMAILGHMKLKISLLCSVSHQPVSSPYSGKRVYVRNKVECLPIFEHFIYGLPKSENISPSLWWFLLSTASILAIMNSFLLSLTPSMHELGAMCNLQSISSNSARWHVMSI